MKMVKIISRELIKPSSPTPSRLQTHNLSLLDQSVPYLYIPMLFFYENCNPDPHEKARKLKKSLSESLTKYYPFAGRLRATPKPPHYVDCNDEGVVFLEAQVDSKLEGFVDKVEQDETLDQLFPDGLVGLKSINPPTVPVAVQLNHFPCGGVALAVSMLHNIGDACTLLNFMNHWATVARCGSVNHELVLPLNPHFISSTSTDDTIHPEARPHVIHQDYVTRKFVFPNSKLSELKNKVIAMAAAGGSTPAIINNPSRVEVLSALLYIRAAATSVSDSSDECFNPSGLCFTLNMRNKMVEKKLPETTAGNVITVLVIVAKNKSELMLNSVVAELQNGKKRLAAGIRDVKEAGEIFNNRITSNKSATGKIGDTYLCTSYCRFPLFTVDFGWGKPVEVTRLMGSAFNNIFVLMDARDGDGIEALVSLGTEHMGRFRNDDEILAFTDQSKRNFTGGEKGSL